MFQNMKVDIIYYKTNTDFEMEFNLCGCCRMRLLTDKAPDRKTMVHSLARAVSRSQIIIVVGSLFGDSGSILSVAEAIGSKLTVADTKTYGIKSNDEINIINGSTPLVTPDGIFGGCIIESGPQTMILLSDNKVVRKALMQTLIHPYIEELYAEELRERHNPADNSENDITAADNELLLETEEETDELIEKEQNSHFITETKEEEAAEISTLQDQEYLLENEEYVPVAHIEDQNTDFLLESEHDGETNPIIDADENLLTDIHEVEELPDEDVLVSAGMLFETEEDNNYEEEPLIEPELSDILSSEEYYELADFEELAKTNPENDEYLSEDSFETQNVRKFSLNLPILILAIILLLTVAILCYCIFFIPSKSDTSSVAFIKETFDILFG